MCRILHKLTDVQEQRLQDLSGAQHTLARLLRMDPANSDVLDRYLELATAANTGKEAAAVIEQTLPQLEPSLAKMWRERVANSGLE